MRLALLLLLALNSCGTSTACLANRYDGYAPEHRCVSGVQLPGGILRDTDPQSGPAAPPAAP